MHNSLALAGRCAPFPGTSRQLCTAHDPLCSWAYVSMALTPRCAAHRPLCNEACESWHRDSAAVRDEPAPDVPSHGTLPFLLPTSHPASFSLMHSHISRLSICRAGPLPVECDRHLRHQLSCCSQGFLPLPQHSDSSFPHRSTAAPAWVLPHAGAQRSFPARARPGNTALIMSDKQRGRGAMETEKSVLTPPEGATANTIAPN